MTQLRITNSSRIVETMAPSNATITDAWTQKSNATALMIAAMDQTRAVAKAEVSLTSYELFDLHQPPDLISEHNQWYT